MRIMPGGGCSFIHPHLLDASSPIPYSSPIPFRLASVCSATIASHRTTCGTAPQHPSPVHPRDAFMRLLTAGTKYVHESNHVRDAFVFENRDRRCASKGRCPRLFYFRACRPWTQSTTLLIVACWLFCQCISACRRRHGQRQSTTLVGPEARHPSTTYMLSVRPRLRPYHACINAPASRVACGNINVYSCLLPKRVFNVAYSRNIQLYTAHRARLYNTSKLWLFDAHCPPGQGRRTIYIKKREKKREEM